MTYTCNPQKNPSLVMNIIFKNKDIIFKRESVWVEQKAKKTCRLGNVEDVVRYIHPSNLQNISSLRAKRSNPAFRWFEKKLDCFARNDGFWIHTGGSRTIGCADFRDDRKEGKNFFYRNGIPTSCGIPSRSFAR